MTRPVESELTISCLQCEWSVETVNTPAMCRERSSRPRTLTWRPTSSTPLMSFSDSGCTARTMPSLRLRPRMSETPR